MSACRGGKLCRMRLRNFPADTLGRCLHECRSRSNWKAKTENHDCFSFWIRGGKLTVSRSVRDGRGGPGARLLCRAARRRTVPEGSGPAGPGTGRGQAPGNPDAAIAGPDNLPLAFDAAMAPAGGFVPGRHGLARSVSMVASGSTAFARLESSDASGWFGPANCCFVSEPKRRGPASGRKFSERLEQVRTRQFLTRAAVPDGQLHTENGLGDRQAQGGNLTLPIGWSALCWQQRTRTRTG